MKKERFEIINDLRSKGLNVNDSDWKDYEHYLSEIKLNDDTTELLKKGKNKYLDYLRCVVSDDESFIRASELKYLEILGDVTFPYEIPREYANTPFEFFSKLDDYTNNFDTNGFGYYHLIDYVYKDDFVKYYESLETTEKIIDDVEDLISIKPDMISNSNSFDKEL